MYIINRGKDITGFTTKDETFRFQYYMKKVCIYKLSLMWWKKARIIIKRE